MLSADCDETAPTNQEAETHPSPWDGTRQRADVDRNGEKLEHVRTLLLQSSNGLLTAAVSQRAGIFVGAATNLDAGTHVLTCPAEGFALDAPFRHSRCAFCVAPPCGDGLSAPPAGSHDEDDADQQPSRLQMCPNCGVVGFCPPCLREHSGYHATHECRAIQRLFATMGRGQGEGEDDAQEVDSSILLTVRLLCRRPCEVAPVVVAGTATSEGEHGAEGRDPLAGSPGSWWKGFQCLYERPLADLGGFYGTLEKDLWLFTADDVKRTLGRVLGCSHAIVDLSLPLGRQAIGKAVFVPHSFYNHSCAPNAFLSTVCTGSLVTKAPSETGALPHHPSLVARVYTIQAIAKGDPVTLSYIPLSGLSLQERQARLQQGYAFDCDCHACVDHIPHAIVLPVDADVDSIRQIQFSCNERLLDVLEDPRFRNHRYRVRRRQNRDEISVKENIEHTDELECIVSMIQMTVRGIHNQVLPDCHEVSIEADRILAMAYGMLERPLESRRYHDRFLEKVARIRGLFDPVAEATQRIEYADVLDRPDDRAREKRKGIALLRVCLGEDHPRLRVTQASYNVRNPAAVNDAKRPRLSVHD